ncbi:MAG: HisA/HisF-related TIM barrel protein [Planctomycetaceae bacterium]
MQVIPVLDLLGGVVVRGVAGQRDSYRPIVSQLVDGSEPLAVARALSRGLGLQRLYVADLDAIVHGRPQWDLYATLAREVDGLLIDAGVSSVELAVRVATGTKTQVVVGLESCPSPAVLAQIVAALPAQQVVFSLDLLRGEPLTPGVGWRGLTPLEMAQAAAGAGVGGLIVLDLAQVGVGAGLSTAALCQQIRGTLPQLPLITGGGVRGPHDLATVEQWGVAGVLVASALHDRQLTAADLARYRH